MTITLPGPRDIKRGGPTGRMTRHRQAEWTGTFRAAFEYRFLPHHFHVDSDVRVWTPVAGIVLLWRDWAVKHPRRADYADASATTITAALKAMGYQYSPVRHRFTPDPRNIRLSSTRGVIMPPAKERWGSWNPQRDTYHNN